MHKQHGAKLNGNLGNDHNNIGALVDRVEQLFAVGIK